MLLVVGFALLLLVPSSQADAKLPAGELLQADSHFSPLAVTRVVRIKFDVANDDYASFLGQLHGVLMNYPKNGDVEGVPVLPPQHLNAMPARWIHVNLVGSGGARTTIALRDDNIYLVGFENSARNWYVFDNRKHLIHDATPLPLNDSYGDLVKGHVNLPRYDLGKTAALGAVQTLASYKIGGLTDSQLAISLAQLCVMVAEAERFKEVADTVSKGWEGTARINTVQAELLVLWGKASCALLHWNNTHVWVDKKGALASQGIRNEQDAVHLLGFVLRTKGCNLKSESSDCGDICN
ncbi:hypothetical protein EJB05_39606 [Eragrostis curvula]|uniref:rRNA N-glycosylase n=1 Tax=Eragrostis curvula TaxID=38414 RepID=A0A5J9TYW6_9POAL|nr:hypothetical protein EJB05_39606 [Eragrostis curvula]